MHKYWPYFKYVSILAFAFSLFCVLNPSTRTFIKNKVLTSERKVLSTVEGRLQHNGQNFKVLKIQNKKGLSLEIYGHTDGSIRRLREKIKLPDNRDGYVQFHGQATNLALQDVDGDNQVEIIAPTYDNNLAAHLNIYRYDEVLDKFELILDEE